MCERNAKRVQLGAPERRNVVAEPLLGLAEQRVDAVAIDENYGNYMKATE